MNKKWRTIMVFTMVAQGTLFLSNEGCAQNAKPVATAATAATAKVAALNVSGPYKSGNLAVYLIHGKDSVPNQKMITLGEALTQKAVKVNETSNVNQLTVENQGKVAVFIQSGDIVKGGQQDRTFQSDLILPPNSGKVPINAFCVEHGRWSQRGSENVKQFSSSSNCLASKSLKIAAKGARNQSDVWQQVSAYQSKVQSKAMEKGYSGAVLAKPSPSSLQLTLESDGVKKLSDNYVKDISPAASGKNDTIGYAFAVNGKINSVDVYSSHDLFSRLWPKLVLASAQEAAAESEKDKTFTPPAVDDVKKYIQETETEKAKESEEKVGGHVITVRRESPKNLYFKTRNQYAAKESNADAWVHKNLIAK
jgi:predicted DNA-binding WGR domain protein